MELKRPAIAGTVESSDVMIAIQPNPGQGIDIQIQSDVMVMFGDAIEKTVRDVLAEFDDVIGIDRLFAVHLNDSLNPRGSHKDRHAKLDEGEIGFEALARFVALEPIRDLPLELETPNELDGYAAEIARMRASESR